MNKQALARKTNKQTEKQTLLSIGLLVAAINGAVITPASGQSMDQSSFLPPEVIPINSAVNYSSMPSSNSAGATPGMVNNNPANAPAMQGQGVQPRLQTANDYRQALFNSLKGTNFEPQANIQNMPQVPGNQAGQATNWPTNNMSNASNMPNFNNQLGQSNLVTPNQFNNSFNTVPAQTQTLSGSVTSAPAAQNRTSGGSGLIHAASLVSLFGMGAMGLASMHGTGSMYSTGIMGTSFLNSGLHSGFMF